MASLETRFEETASFLSSQRQRAEEARAEEIRDRRRNQRRAATVEALKENWMSVLERDKSLVEASNQLFGDPKASNVRKLGRDIESRPGKGEAEVETVYADSLFIPLGAADSGLETYGVVRLWGISRSGDIGGKTIATNPLRFDRERGAGPNFFDVFSFDGYQICYAAGSSAKISGSDEEPLGTDLKGRKVYGQMITKAAGGDPSAAGDLLAFGTLNSNSMIWAEHVLEQLGTPDLAEETRKERLRWIRATIKTDQTQLDNYAGALNELVKKGWRS